MSLFAEYEPLRHGAPPPDGLTTRPAAPEDLGAVAAMRVERGDAVEEQARAWFRRILARAAEDRALLLVADLGGVLAGYGSLESLSPPGLPQGWYLGGLVVRPAWRRRGVGARLTRDRLAWVAARSPRAWYFVNERNRASIDLHAPFGFREVARDIRVPGVSFTGGVGLLYGADLSGAASRPGTAGGDAGE